MFKHKRWQSVKLPEPSLQLCANSVLLTQVIKVLVTTHRILGQAKRVVAVVRTKLKTCQELTGCKPTGSDPWHTLIQKYSCLITNICPSLQMLKSNCLHKLQTVPPSKYWKHVPNVSQQVLTPCTHEFKNIVVSLLILTLCPAWQMLKL